MIPLLFISAAAESAWTAYCCYLGEAVVAGGAYAYRREIYQGAKDWFFTSQPNPTEPAARRQALAHELSRYHQEPINQACLLHDTTKAHLDSHASQARLHQDSLNDAVIHLNDMVNQATTLASTLDTLIPNTHQLTDDTHQTVDTMKTALHHLIQDLAQTRDRIQTSQQALSRIEHDFSSTVHRLNQWEQSLSSSCQIGQQMMELSHLERQARLIGVRRDEDKDAEIQMLKQERDALIKVVHQTQALLGELTQENDDLHCRLTNRQSNSSIQKPGVESKFHDSPRLFTR